MNIQRKPYEISLWKTEYNTTTKELEEVKLGIIGSTEMEDSPFRAHEPHLIENINGSKTLTFSIFWRYYNYIEDVYESNPWEKYLVNERKVKLKYDGEWYEFVIKEVEESKEEYKKTFTCVSAPILELSRNGYNVELDDTLYNNQGTAIELAQRILDGSDWVVDKDNSDDIYSFYTEHLYHATTKNQISVTAIKEGKGEIVDSIPSGANVYLFYSEKEKNANPVQLLYNWEELEPGTIPANVDSNNVIINETIYLYEGSVDDFNVGDIDLTYKCARLVLSQLGHYDPVLKAFVKDYEDEDGARKYGYTETKYLTSDVIGNLINNPKDYMLTKSQETLTSWGTYVQNWYASSGASLTQTTYPGLCDLGGIVEGTKIDLNTNPEKVMVGLMRWKLPTIDKYIYNTSTKENLVFLPNGIIKGNKYVFRAKFALLQDTSFKTSGYMDVPSILPEKWSTPLNSCLVCTVTMDGKPLSGMNCTTTNRNNPQIYERVEGTIGVTNPHDEGWYEYNGTSFSSTEDATINENKKYYKDIRSQTKIPYYYGIMTATESYSKEELNNSSLQVRISCAQPTPYSIVVEDVELFQYEPDIECDYKIIDASDSGNEIDCFYPPGSPLISDIKQDLKIFDQNDNVNRVYETQYVWEREFEGTDNTDPYKPVYNDYLAINSVNGAQSNYYNLVQEICETFQCWADFRIDHNEDGSIKPTKYYYLTPDISADPAATYYIKNGNNYEEIVIGTTVIDETPYDPTNPDNYYNPRVLGWYEMKNTGKTVVLKNYIGKENYAGFRYGINLSGITRSLDSNEFVSKMIVANNDTEGAANGTCSVERADDNPTGTSSLYDFTYYVNQQLLDDAALQADLYGANDGLGFYPNLKRLTKQHMDLIDEWNLMFDQMTVQGARKQVAQAESDAARDQQSEAFEDLCAFIRNDSGYMSYTYGKVYPSDNNAGKLVAEFVEKFWADEPEHNSTIDYWVKYVNATNILNKALDDLETATNLYDKAEKRAKAIQILLATIEAEITKRSKEFFNKYSDFIQEGTWNDADALDDDLYYYDAAQVLRTSAQPKVSYQINVIEISELEGYEPYKFAIGDKTYIEDTEFFGWTTSGSPYREEVVVSEINWALDDPATNQITVQNYRTQFEDLFQRMSAAVQQAELNANAYNRAAQIVQPSGKIDQGALQKTFTQNSNDLSMEFGTGSITQNSEGIIIEGFGTDRKNKLKITGKGIFITKDNGETWTPVMRGTGTNASTLTDGTLDVSTINIVDAGAPSFQWNGEGLTAYGFKDLQFDPAEYSQGGELWVQADPEEIAVSSSDTWSVVNNGGGENNGD